MGMDMAARAMAKGAEQRAVKQGSTKLAAVDKRIFSLPNAADGALSVEGVKGKTLQNVLTENKTISHTVQGSIRYERFNGIFKPSTIYTCFVYVTKNIANVDPITYGLYVDGANEDTISPTSNPFTKLDGSKQTKEYLGRLIYKFTSKNSLPTNPKLVIGVHSDYGYSTQVEIKDIMLLEGDWTNKEVPPYFEGIKSVGEDTGKLSVKSMTPNIIDPKSWEIGGVAWASGGNYPTNDRLRTIGFIEVMPGLTIKTNENVYFVLYDKNFNYLGTGKVGDKTGVRQGKTYQVENEVKNIRLIIGNSTDFSFASKVTGTYLNEITTNSNFGESKIEIPLTEPLRSLPNGVSDEIKDGKIIRRVGKVVLNGTQHWNIASEFINAEVIGVYGGSGVDISKGKVHGENDLYCDKLTPYHGGNTTGKNLIGLKSKVALVGLEKSRLSTPDTAGVKAWFQANPTTLYFELETPMETPITIPAINSFTNGMVTVENNIWPNELTVSYSTNVVARVINAESTLSGVLASTLTLADKELAMKSLTTLATGASLTDAVNKVNQILNIWR